MAAAMVSCTQCGGDVVRLFVGTTVKYVHAVKGIDHGPLPATPRSQPQPTSPTSRPTEAASPASRVARADAG
jgi:hypothetical protein